MVKLLKHELIALFRVLVFFAAAVAVFAVIGRILLAVDYARLENGDQNGALLSLVFVMFYVFAIVALVFAAWALGVSRFYKTLFTGEGYMTLSLPVSPMEIILAKLLSSLIAVFAAAAVSALSLFIFFIGVDSDILHAIGMDIEVSFQMWFDSIAAEPFIFVEEFLLFLVTVPAALLAVYACISLGQLFTNRRKLMTFAIAIAAYIVVQMLALFCIQPIYDAAEEVSRHLLLWVQILLYAAVDAGCFFLIRYILRNKVNLIV